MKKITNLWRKNKLRNLQNSTLAGVKQRIPPCTTEEFPRPAPRPKNSRLEKKMLKLCNLPPMPDWHDALAEFMQQEFSKA